MGPAYQMASSHLTSTVRVGLFKSPLSSFHDWLAFSTSEWIYSTRLQWSLTHLGVIWIFTIWSFCVDTKVSIPKCNLIPKLLEKPHHRAHLMVFKWSDVHFKYIYHSLCNIHNRLQREMTAEYENQVVDYRNGLAKKWWGSN